MDRFKYYKKILEILNLVYQNESNNIIKASKVLAEAIIDKHSIFAFGASHAGIIRDELYDRAGGLVVINPIFARELMLDNATISNTSKMERLEGYGSIIASSIPWKKNDVVIIHSVSGRNPVSIEIAIEAKNKGVTVIGITNMKYSSSVTSRHSGNKNLYEYCDIIIDNHGDIGDACVAIEETPLKVSPSSTVVGACIVNEIVALAVEELVEKKVEPLPVYYSANVDGGDERNSGILKKYKDLIHYNY